MTDETFGKLLAAFEDVFEAKRELDQAKSEYTGYSPSYHLQAWRERADKARADLKLAIESLVASG